MSDNNLKIIKPIRACDIILIACVLLVAVTMLFFRDNTHSEDITAVIRKNDTVINRVELISITEPKEITVDGDIPVTLLIESDGVTVLHSECKDKICEKTGKLTYAGGSIVCLPAGVSIELEGQNSEIDAVVR